MGLFSGVSTGSGALDVRTAVMIPILCAMYADDIID